MYEFLSMCLAAKSRLYSDYGFYRMKRKEGNNQCVANTGYRRHGKDKIGITRFHRMIPEGGYKHFHVLRV